MIGEFAGTELVPVTTDRLRLSLFGGPSPGPSPLSVVEAGSTALCDSECVESGRRLLQLHSHVFAGTRGAAESNPVKSFDCRFTNPTSMLGDSSGDLVLSMHAHKGAP